MSATVPSGDEQTNSKNQTRAHGDIQADILPKHISNEKHEMAFDSL
jgi:hypothetical protein